MKPLITIFLIIGFTYTNGQSNLIGKWRKVNPSLKNEVSQNKLNQPGDFLINPDSTFFILSDTAFRNSKVSGWHVGEELKGTWEQPDGTHLTLWLNPKSDRIFLSFVIIKLTNEKLVLRSSLERKRKKSSHIIYLRI